MTRFGWKWGMSLLAVSLTAFGIAAAAAGFFDGNGLASLPPLGWTWDD